jgi:hypothetical protein
MAETKVCSYTNLHSSENNMECHKTAVSNKLAMSRALGAAFLSHQVEQLEKSVQSVDLRGNNWRNRNEGRRDRRPASDYDRGNRSQTNGANLRGPLPVGGIRIATKNSPNNAFDRSANARFTDGDREPRLNKAEKEGDIIVLDASVLVNALGQVRKWCRDGRDEILIVPLEGVSFIKSYGYRNLKLRSTEHA